MSETNVLTVADVAVGNPRRATVSKEAFYNGVIAGSVAGKTPAQVASDLGMEVLSFNQRLVQMRKEVKALNKVMPKLADARTKGNATGRKSKPLPDSILSALMNASESAPTE
jgi:hypothetical protein